MSRVKQPRTTQQQQATLPVPLPNTVSTSKKQQDKGQPQDKGPSRPRKLEHPLTPPPTSPVAPPPSAPRVLQHQITPASPESESDNSASSSPVTTTNKKKKPSSTSNGSSNKVVVAKHHEPVKIPVVPVTISIVKKSSNSKEDSKKGPGRPKKPKTVATVAENVNGGTGNNNGRREEVVGFDLMSWASYDPTRANYSFGNPQKLPKPVSSSSSAIIQTGPASATPAIKIKVSLSSSSSSAVPKKTIPPAPKDSTSTLPPVPPVRAASSKKKDSSSSAPGTSSTGSSTKPPSASSTTTTTTKHPTNDSSSSSDAEEQQPPSTPRIVLKLRPIGRPRNDGARCYIPVLCTTTHSRERESRCLPSQARQHGIQCDDDGKVVVGGERGWQIDVVGGEIVWKVLQEGDGPGKPRRKKGKKREEGAAVVNGSGGGVADKDKEKKDGGGSGEAVEYSEDENEGEEVGKAASGSAHQIGHSSLAVDMGGIGLDLGHLQTTTEDQEQDDQEWRSMPATPARLPNDALLLNSSLPPPKFKEHTTDEHEPTTVFEKLEIEEAGMDLEFPSRVEVQEIQELIPEEVLQQLRSHPGINTDYLHEKPLNNSSATPKKEGEQPTTPFSRKRKLSVSFTMPSPPITSPLKMDMDEILDMTMFDSPRRTSPRFATKIPTVQIHTTSSHPLSPHMKLNTTTPTLLNNNNTEDDGSQLFAFNLGTPEKNNKFTPARVLFEDPRGVHPSVQWSPLFRTGWEEDAEGEPRRKRRG